MMYVRVCIYSVCVINIVVGRLFHFGRWPLAGRPTMREEGAGIKLGYEKQVKTIKRSY